MDPSWPREPLGAAIPLLHLLADPKNLPQPKVPPEQDPTAASQPPGPKEPGQAQHIQQEMLIPPVVRIRPSVTRERGQRKHTGGQVSKN